MNDAGFFNVDNTNFYLFSSNENYSKDPGIFHHVLVRTEH